MAAGNSTAGDPIADSLDGVLKPSVAVFLEHHHKVAKYRNSDFPMERSRFREFRNDLVSEFIQALNLEDWVVRNPSSKDSPIATWFKDRVVARKEIHGVRVEIHAVTIHPSGLVVPAVVCLPAGDVKVPGVCTFSGHSGRGLNDMVVNLESYQQGIATRLAQAGIASIAVEKIDTGYLSRNGARGVDEKEIASLLLGHREVLRAHQIRACIAAVEILAAHPRVDETRIGATGVSLGGWLTIQTAMFNDRIKAVADFGRKTRTISTEMTPAKYRGQGDLCHIIPGILALCGRNIHPLALAPMPMLAGHGIKDTGSHAEHLENYRQLGEAQYQRLGARDNYTYLVHAGGDTMPAQETIAWFRKQFGMGEEK
ncbi:MAG: hypothetical protein CMO80_07890 [Verrucomicrobiales bacterium]|nr:hypothetical protein [Verrucomicrobiales bacterium]|tara:strand:+ start:740 stop:1846 length:1107 start_codon:yes stop_codon:yes gene_type:complete